jgi:lipoprotein-anchoring transpeptidase ErfK/SrfK
MPYAVNFSEKGYFFHHQSLPGKPASHGCIRLLKVDAERLFYWIGKNDPVIITDLKKQLSKSCFFFYF